MRLITKILYKASSALRNLGRRLSSDAEWLALLAKWRRLDPEKQYRTNYPELNAHSVVFDLGGYQGQWASDIYGRYRCPIYVFEPHPDYVKKIVTRFQHNDDIKVFAFGLGNREQSLLLSTDDDSSSVFKSGDNGVPIVLKTASTFFEHHQIDRIDLMKINIEGGEYELLDHLIETGDVKKIRNLQIQFHHFVPDAASLMDKLQERLAETHAPTYLYRFFWENWRLKE